jgi:hypothetical protein
MTTHTQEREGKKKYTHPYGRIGNSFSSMSSMVPPCARPFELSLRSDSRDMR